jgi:hypothetical protein
MGGPAAPALLSRLEDVTEGNPFFLDEILRGLDAVASATPAPVDGVRVTLPESLREALHRRVDPLAEDTRSLLATASVIGREFDVALLQSATGLPSSVVLQQLTAAATAGADDEPARATIGRRMAVRSVVIRRVAGVSLRAPAGPDGERIERIDRRPVGVHKSNRRPPAGPRLNRGGRT